MSEHWSSGRQQGSVSGGVWGFEGFEALERQVVRRRWRHRSV